VQVGCDSAECPVHGLSLSGAWRASLLWLARQEQKQCYKFEFLVEIVVSCWLWRARSSRGIHGPAEMRTGPQGLPPVPEFVGFVGG
jgi:hypothetical protein